MKDELALHLAESPDAAVLQPGIAVHHAETEQKMRPAGRHPLEETIMAQVTDPVCGMTIDSDKAAAQSQFEGRTFHFCATECKRQFDADPGRYAGAAHGSTDREVPLEKHEAPFTKAGMPAPKFGSAGSGGAELDPGPERHARPDRPE